MTGVQTCALPISLAPWPTVDPALLIEDSVECIVQVAGKIKARLEVSPDISEDDLRTQALALAGVDSPTRVIVRAPKLVNIIP